ncbi:hypothetical protein AB3X90_40970, partial [Paraburkholderia sp. BR14427]
PVHRFYQAWQQADCAVEHASRENPSGCLGDLFAWVETTIGAGNLPAVSFVKPGGLLDGHPTSSKFGLYEAFVRKLVDAVK